MILGSLRPRQSDQRPHPASPFGLDVLVLGGGCVLWSAAALLPLDTHRALPQIATQGSPVATGATRVLPPVP